MPYVEPYKSLYPLNIKLSSHGFILDTLFNGRLELEQVPYISKYI